MQKHTKVLVPLVFRSRNHPAFATGVNEQCLSVCHVSAKMQMVNMPIVSMPKSFTVSQRTGFQTKKCRSIPIHRQPKDRVLL